MTSSDQLLAAGIPIMLVGGRVVHLRYTMRGLKALEDAFGSVGAVQEAISTDGTGKQFGPLTTVLRCGLHHEGFATDDDLIDHLDLRLLSAYADAIPAAINQAFPDLADDEPVEGRPNLEDVSLPPGPGLSGTTPPLSSSVATIAASG